MTDKELIQEAIESIEWLRLHLERDHACLHMKPTVSGIPDWLNKAKAALRARLAQPEPAECDGGQCGIGGYCKQCPKTQPEQEPVAWMWNVHSGAGYTSRGIDFYPTSIPFAKHTPLYTAPPQREWVGLTDEEYEAMAEQYVTNCYFDTLKYAKAIEAKLKEKNT